MLKKVIVEKGLTDYISFDNDLGQDDCETIASDGYEAAKWLVYESGYDLTKLQFNVQSGFISV